MADIPARAGDETGDTDASESPSQFPTGPLTVRDLIDTIVERARVRIRWVGAARMLGGVGAVIVLAGLGWWLMRSPALPTEAALPVATHAGGASTTVDTRPVAVVATTDAASPVLVHVTGAVVRPGVYELAAGARVADAVAAAGGAGANADPNALNLAAPVIDGDRIEIPVVGAAQLGESGAGHSHATTEGSAAASPSAPVDLNEATASDLEELPGIGPATAAAIVQYRTDSGPFATVDDLLDVPGIGPAKLEAIRDAVTT